MLYKRKLISSKSWWRVRKELHRNCLKCFSDHRNCSDYLINIYSSIDGRLFKTHLEYCCKRLENKCIYVEEICNI